MMQAMATHLALKWTAPPASTVQVTRAQLEKTVLLATIAPEAHPLADFKRLSMIVKQDIIAKRTTSRQHAKLISFVLQDQLFHYHARMVPWLTLLEQVARRVLMDTHALMESRPSVESTSTSMIMSTTHTEGFVPQVPTHPQQESGTQMTAGPVQRPSTAQLEDKLILVSLAISASQVQAHPHHPVLMKMEMLLPHQMVATLMTVLKLTSALLVITVKKEQKRQSSAHWVHLPLRQGLDRKSSVLNAELDITASMEKLHRLNALKVTTVQQDHQSQQSAQEPDTDQLHLEREFTIAVPAKVATIASKKALET